jgi:beta-aspartyl-peptidase (threonine type)
MGLALIVHGGAGDVPAEQLEERRRGVDVAARAGWDVLQQGGRALDAVEAAVVLMEDNPVFDAGVGSVLNRAGQVEMDAAIMDGGTLDVGAVAGVSRIRYPIRLARRVLESEWTFLIANGAEQFGQQSGMPLIDNADLHTPEQIAKWKGYLTNPPVRDASRYLNPKGTVGCVAVDEHGDIAAGTSTGGTSFKPVGRVGDSPLIGCGLFADNLLGGASATGWGESITRVVLCKYAVDLLAVTDPQDAARKAIEYLARRVGGNGGIILVDGTGRTGFAFNTSHMARAYAREGMTHIVSEV